jgi:hypothetical protein
MLYNVLKYISAFKNRFAVSIKHLYLHKGVLGLRIVKLFVHMGPGLIKVILVVPIINIFYKLGMSFTPMLGLYYSSRFFIQLSI